MLKDSNGQTSYTRAGMFQRDASNYLTTANGTRLQGYTTNDAGELQSGVVGDIQVKAGSLPAKASDQLEFVANLKADASIITPPPRRHPLLTPTSQRPSAIPSPVRFMTRSELSIQLPSIL